jgi:hypothetical protein
MMECVGPIGKWTIFCFAFDDLERLVDSDVFEPQSPMGSGQSISSSSITRADGRPVRLAADQMKLQPVVPKAGVLEVRVSRSSRAWTQSCRGASRDD